MIPRLAITLAAAITIPRLAQTKPTPPNPSEMAKHQVKSLTTPLSLSSAQQQQATTIYTSAAKGEQAIRKSEKDGHEGVRSGIKNNDTATIDQISRTLAASTAQWTAIKAKADVNFCQILTPEQRTKLSELESQQMGPLDGPGGPGGPPAGGCR